VRSRLRLFAVVGLIATAIDIGLYLTLRNVLSDGADLSFLQVLSADVVALTAAALAAYVLNRSFTFRGQRNARWVSHPLSFALTALVAGLVDLGVVLALEPTGLDPAVGKVAAIAVAAVVRWLSYRWILFSEVRRELAERRVRPPAPGSFRLSVVVPAFREEAGVASSIKALREELEPLVGSDQLEILVVDDGSPDDTAGAAERAGATVVRLPENKGKGAAVRAGVLAAEGRSIVFTDADLAYPASMVRPILAELEDGWDIVVGSRRHEETTTLVRARRLRELGGRGVNWLTHLVLLGRFRDTQCGIKGFRSDVGRALFERTLIDGFAFDVEVFLIAEQDSMSLTEVPVKVENRQGSSVRIVADTGKLLADLVRIRRAAGRGAYRPSPEQEAVLSAAGR